MDRDRHLDLAQLLKRKSSQLRHVSTRVTMPSGQVWDEVDGRRVACGRPTTEGYVVDTKPDLQIGRVTDRLYVSSQDVADDVELLRQHQISSILKVTASPTTLRHDHIDYLELAVLDLPEEPLADHLPQCFRFIERAVEGDGRVLVHCNAGVSRSVAVVVAYLMPSRRLTYAQALAAVQRVRPTAKPNAGFVKQLQSYEHQCIGQRHEGSPSDDHVPQ